MKNILALAIAAAMASSMAIAANTPDNVGDVTYLGNIVANSPMWQWTVNDYPGGRLDVKPSAATTANGKTTYPLTASPFIAVSGYLPSTQSINDSTIGASNIGLADITTFTDGNGNPITDIADMKKGAVTFTISANSTNISGTPVVGKLTLTSTELRAARLAGTDSSGNKSNLTTTLLASTTSGLPITSGSCFSGVGSYSSTSNVVGGTAIAPTTGEQSPTAFNALLAALSSADANGSAPKFSTLTGYLNNGAITGSSTCSNSSSSVVGGAAGTTQGNKYNYLAAAHIVELTPKSLVFNEPVSGAWNATLNVTAYQM
ncbi:TPA: hypothetical protein ACSPKR_003176 [Providencia rettgeri]